MRQANTVIIGAGITGLTCASFLKNDYLILEKESTPGGLCRSINVNGFTFDYGGHFIHLRDNNIKSFVHKCLHNNIIEVNRNSWVYTFDRYMPFPFQANLSYLPDKIKKDCVNGFFKKTTKKSSDSFLNWSLRTFGTGITKHFMKPYNEKLWTIPADKLSDEWVSKFVPAPTKQYILDSANTRKANKLGYNASFYYPLKGGCGSFVKCISKLTDRPLFDNSVKKIDLKNKTIETENGNKYCYNTLVSTQPLFELIKQIKNVPEHILKAAKNLKWNKVLCYNLGIKYKNGADSFADKKHWIYFPEKKYPYYRVGVYSNVAPSMAPDRHAAVYIESSSKPDNVINTKQLYKNIINSLKQTGFITNESQIVSKNLAEIPCAYVIYDSKYSETIKTIHSFLNRNNVYSIGRYGAWKYSFIEESLLDGKKTAALINSL